MNTIIIATSNKSKIREANSAFSNLGVSFEPVSLDIHEIQNPNGETVAIEKAKEAYKTLNKPLVVNDTYWEIPALNGFPGPYMRDIDRWFSVEDWLKLTSGIDKKIVCIENVVFIEDDAKIKVFTRKYTGNFKDQPKGQIGNGNSALDLMIGFDNTDETLAPLRALNRSFFNLEENCWLEFAKWYKRERIDNIKP